MPILHPESLMLITNRPRLSGDLLRAFEGGRRFRLSAWKDSGDGTLKRVFEQQPKAVLIDALLRERRAEELVERIARRSAIKPILVGVAGDEGELVRYLERGARGYVKDGFKVSELIRVVEETLAGEMGCTPELGYTLLVRLAELSFLRRQFQKVKSLLLSTRELDILHLVAEGRSNREIASALCLSIHTVKNHVHNIIRKLKVKNRAEAVDFAYRKRWLREPGWSIRVGNRAYATFYGDGGMAR